MAFKSIKQIEEDRFSKFLRLTDDEKSITGVILYSSYEDVLIADCHYVNTKDYKGYVHCCDSGCPACRKGIRVQHKLFMPILVLADLNEDYDEDTVVFWDRNMSFNHQLRKEVFENYPCPADTVFKITRHGAYRDINTTYSITPKYNFPTDINEVLDNMGISFPDYYEHVVRSVDAATLSDMLAETAQSSANDAYTPQKNYSYQVTPRKKFADPESDAESMEEVELPGVEVSSSDTSLADFDPSEKKLQLKDFEASMSDYSDSDDEFEPTF